MALLALSACDDAGGMLAGLQLPALSKETPNTALAQSQMANSAFTLVPPQGFCIDKNTLRQRFALMARCDVLGAPSLAAGAPMGLITVSVTPQTAEAPLPTPEETAMAARLTNVEGVTSEVDALTFRADGKPPASGFGDTHWRGSVRLGDQVMGLALYGEDGGRAASAEGREILNDLIRSTREANKPNG